MPTYSAEMVSDNGRFFDSESLISVRIRPPLDITQALIDTNALSGVEVEHLATTLNASVYNVSVRGEAGQNTEADHQERVARAKRFISGILGEVNVINDLSSSEWAHGLKRVGDI